MNKHIYSFLWRLGLPGIFCICCSQTALAGEEDLLSKASAIQALSASFSKQQHRLPAPVPHIHTEGTLPHQGIYDDSVAAKQDLKRMYQAALLWSATHHQQYLSFAADYLMAWINTYQPDFNPVDETGFDDMINTYAIIKHQLSAAAQTQTADYFSAWAWGYVNRISHHTDHKKTWSNNWQSHRIKLITLIAAALQDRDLLIQARIFFQAQIRQNIDIEGQTIDFKQRNAIHYVVYDLQPLVQAALAARTFHEDWYHWTAENNASLAHAINWLTPYATGHLPHEEFAHSTVPFDIIRQQAHIRGFSGLFNPKDAGTLYWYLTLINKQFIPTAQAMMPIAPAFITLSTFSASLSSH